MYKVLKPVTYMGRMYNPGDSIREEAPDWLEKKWIENRVVAFEKEAATTKKAGTAKKSAAAEQKAAQGSPAPGAENEDAKELKSGESLEKDKVK